MQTIQEVQKKNNTRKFDLSYFMLQVLGHMYFWFKKKRLQIMKKSFPWHLSIFFFCHKSTWCRPISGPSSGILACFFRKDARHSFCFCIPNWKRHQFQHSLTMNELKKNFRKEKNKRSDYLWANAKRTWNLRTYHIQTHIQSR